MIRYRFFLLSVTVLLTSCNPQETGWRLPPTLSEVSGLASYGNKLLLHEDESSAVYRFDFESGKVELAFQIGSPPISGDFEGIAVQDQDVLITTSSGRLYKVHDGADASGKVVRATVVDTGLEEICEVEGLDYSELGLLFVCKQNYLVPQSRLLIYKFKDDALTLFLEVDLKPEVGKFRPSAIHYQEEQIFVASAKPKKLLRLDRDGNLLSVHSLKGMGLPQPEGLTFVGPDLYVASEGAKGGAIKTINLDIP